MQGATYSVELATQWYSVRVEQAGPGNQLESSWNPEAFKLLPRLYQITVTNVSRALTPQITIAK